MIVLKDRSNILIDKYLREMPLPVHCNPKRGVIMKDKLYETYYKRGFDHFIFKRLLNLKKPKKEAKLFYIGIIFLILVSAFLIG